MTIKDRLKDTCDYFGWDFPSLSNFDLEKLGKIWHVEPVIEVVDKIIEKVIIKERIVYKKIKEKDIKPIPKHEYDEGYMINLLKGMCKDLGFNYMRCFTPDREQKIIKAKVWFSRKMKTDFPDITCIELKEFFKCDHTTIIHYWNTCKVDCPILPLTNKVKGKWYKHKKQLRAA